MTASGSDVQGVISLLRLLSMVAAGCATAAAILGYQVLRRSRSARLALTVLAVPLFLTGLVTGGFVSSVVAASAVMLWLQPARDWFNGVTPAQAGAAAAARRPDRPAPPPCPRRPSRPRRPGRARRCSRSPPVPRGHAAGRVAGRAARRDDTAPHRRLGLRGHLVLQQHDRALMIASTVVVAVRPELVFDEVHRQNPDLAEQGITDTVLAVSTYVMSGFVVLWCVSAIVVAVLVWRRVAWARIVLIVCASSCRRAEPARLRAGAFLLAFPLVAGIATIALLLRPESRPWFDRPAG